MQNYSNKEIDWNKIQKMMMMMTTRAEWKEDEDNE